MQTVPSSQNRLKNRSVTRILRDGKQISLHCPSCKSFIAIDLQARPEKNDSIQISQSMKRIQKKRSVPLTGTPDEGTSSQALKKKILTGLTGNLPPMPQILFKAQEVMSDPDSGSKDLAKIIATDQALAIKVLKLANSAYYGLVSRVTSIGHATSLLGSKRLGEIIMMAGTLNLLGGTLKGYGLKSGDLWRHSLAVGIGSRIIAMEKIPGLANDAFTAGIIHDSGKLMLDEYVFKRKEAIEQVMKDGQQTFLSAEKTILGLDHPEIGSEVCKTWGIPEPLTKAIRYHHYPSLSDGDELAYILNAADTIAMMSGIGNGIDHMLYQIDKKAMQFLGVQEKDLIGIMAEVIQLIEKLTERILEL